MLESTEAFKKFAGSKSWKDLDFQTQQQIRLFAILEQSTKKYGKEVKDNTNSAMAEFTAILKDIGLTISNQILPPFNRFLKENIIPMTKELEKLTAKFEKLPKSSQNTIIAFAGVAAGMGPLLLIIGTIVKILPTIGTAFSALAGFLMGPVGLIVMAIAGIGIALGYLYNTNEWFREKMNGIWTQIQETATTIFGYLKEYWAEWGPTIVGYFLSVWDGIKVILSMLLFAFQVTWPLISNVVMVAIKFVSRAIAGLIRILKGTIDFFVGVFTGDWERAWGGIKDIFGGAWDLIKNIALSAVESIVGVVDGMVKGIKKALEWFGILKKEESSAKGDYDYKTPSQRRTRQMSVGHNFTGTTGWKGGWTWVGENGPELVNLSRGTQVKSNLDSRNMMKGEERVINVYIGNDKIMSYVDKKQGKTNNFEGRIAPA